MIIFLIFVLVLSDGVLCDANSFEENDGKLCNRECIQDENRICYFKFVLEHYHVMGP